MFVIPALLSITLDSTLAIVYFLQLLGEEEKDNWLHLLDPSHSNFDLVRACVRRGPWEHPSSHGHATSD